MTKFNVKIKTTIAVILSLLCLNLSSVRADDSDIFGANIEPNVMLLIDTSTSMNTEITSSIYAPTTDYTGSQIGTKVYKIKNKDSFSVYKQTVDEVPNSSAQSALNTAGYWVGQIGGSTVILYLGNYINYQNCGSSCDVPEAKIDIAKRVYSAFVQNVEGIRFGVMRLRSKLNPPDNLPELRRGELIAEIGTTTQTIVDTINDIVPERGTPLGWQLEDAGRYYKGDPLIDSNQYTSPIQYECQPNFVILMSDGIQNDGHPVQDEATLRYTQDHSPLTGTQNVIVHTIGFDITGDAVANDNLRDAAENGGGNFYVANNAVDLELRLLEAIQQIVESVFTFATPVVPTTSTTGSTRAYVAAVQSDPDSVFWKGYLKAYDRVDGAILLNADGTPDSSKLAWEAGDRLSNPASPVYKTAAQRNIYFQSGDREDFVTSKVLRGLVGAADNAERDLIVNFIRGVDVLDEDGDGIITEDRAWKLGDIFHSTPVFVSQPRMPIVDASYDDFKKLQAVIDRPSVLIVGANDGMLHAFRESDGEELWAWVPEHVFLNLKDLLATSGAHSYFVDGSPIAADIKDGDTWKTIVMFGLRRGGRHYYALDITDTASPTLLWNFTDSKMGETWSEPSIGKIKWTDGTDKYVAFVGGGYDTDDNNQSGKAFFVIDLATGAKLAEYYNDEVTIDDRQYMNFSIPANPMAIDEDGDGYVDMVYVGDVGGQLWKFEPEVTPDTTTPETYKYSYFGPLNYEEKIFSMKLKNSVTDAFDLYLASTITNNLMSIPANCTPDCYVYENDGGDPENESHSNHFGFISLDWDVYGNVTTFTGPTLMETIAASSTSGSFTLKGKRLFEADTVQPNTPAVGEYFPAQAIYGAPSVAKDNAGNLWVSFGTGDRNHPLNSSTNRFYGIKDNTTMTNANTLTESDLLEIDSNDTTVSTSIQGWYFTLASAEKVLAAADTFNGTVFFTTFTPDSGSGDVCGSGGGTAKLFAVKLESGFAALDFTSDDNEALTSNYVGTSRWTKIGDGIPSKPAVMINPNGNPSVITGTTSQQISSEKVPYPPFTQLLGWREVF